MSCGIYCIENLINGHKYIGQSICIENRWIEHKNGAFNSNCKEYNKILYKAFRKYGIENFSLTILEECEESKEILKEREIYWINYYNTYFGEGYNATLGGDNSARFIDIQELYNKWDSGMSVKEIVKFSPQ